MIKYHPIWIKDAENVPDVGKEHNATVQRALTPVTDKVLCTIHIIINHTRKVHQGIIHTYACTYIFTYMQFQYQLHLHKQFQEVYL